MRSGRSSGATLTRPMVFGILIKFRSFRYASPSPCYLVLREALLLITNESVCIGSADANDRIAFPKIEPKVGESERQSRIEQQGTSAATLNIQDVDRNTLIDVYWLPALSL